MSMWPYIVANSALFGTAGFFVLCLLFVVIGIVRGDKPDHDEYGGQ